MDSISDKIKQICKENGLKQEVIASELGITQGTLAGKLAKNDNVKYKLLLDIANILNVSVIDIITFPDKYIKQSVCEECKKKSETIENLNKYIRLIETKT